MDAHEILWADTSVYQRLYEKTATALIAVERTLRSKRLLGGAEDEFLELCGVLTSADADLFTQIWQDPAVYYWTRRAYELVGACSNPGDLPAQLKDYCVALGAPDPRAALPIHLEQFKKFILALELARGGSRRFQRAFEAKLPFAIAGSKYSILGSGSISIPTISGGSIEIIRDGVSSSLRPANEVMGSDAPQLVERPQARRGDCELSLKPEAFYLPGIGAADSLRQVPADFQGQQVRLLETALGLVERHHPLAFGHFSEVVKLIAFKPSTTGDYSNISYSDLPGAFILSAMREPYWMADALIHELFHNRLFFIEEREAILELSDDGGPTEFYSPWRDDQRPLSGLLHALYVYIAVSQFWYSVSRSGETTGARKDYVEDQAVRATLQLRIAIHQLRRYARFTEFGAPLFMEMEKAVAAALESMRALKLSAEAPAMIARADGNIVIGGTGADGRPLSIIDTMRKHARQFDVHGQCSDFDPLPA